MASLGGTVGIWLTLHLAFSSATSGDGAAALSVDPTELSVLPISITLAYIIPTGLMCLPAPSTLSRETKDGLIMAWQLWPLGWSFLHSAVVRLVRAVAKQPDNKTNVKRNLDAVYTFGLALGSFTHISCLTISGLTLIFPMVYKSEYAASFHPPRVFLPELPFPSTKTSNIGEGALWFLQWDYTTSAVAMLIWSLNLRYQAKKREQEGTPVQWLKESMSLITQSLIVGPLGVVLLNLWERDHLVLDREASEGAKSEQKRE